MTYLKSGEWRTKNVKENIKEIYTQKIPIFNKFRI